MKAVAKVLSWHDAAMTRPEYVKACLDRMRKFVIFGVEVMIKTYKL